MIAFCNFMTVAPEHFWKKTSEAPQKTLSLA
jgi:hypothetical protein